MCGMRLPHFLFLQFPLIALKCKKKKKNAYQPKNVAINAGIKQI